MAARSASQPFRFLPLPGEMRNQIYELLLVGRNVKHRGPYIEHVEEAIKAPVPAILQTNRQIRQEAGSIYYTHALFHLSLYWNHWPIELKVYRDWKSTLPTICAVSKKAGGVHGTVLACADCP